MNILQILKSKPHNLHYLNRYIKFIEYCGSNPKVGFETEEHHICPQASDMFPEFSCLKSNPWNGIKLTLREHFLAHWMLWKSFRATSQSFAFNLMCNRSNFYSSRLYESLRKDFIELRNTPEYIEKQRNGLDYYYSNVYTKEMHSRFGKFGEDNPTFGHKWTDEQKASLRPLRLGANNGFYDKHHSQETKLIMRNLKLGKTGELCPNFGRKHTKEQNDAHGESIRGRKKHYHKDFDSYKMFKPELAPNGWFMKK